MSNTKKNIPGFTAHTISSTQEYSNFNSYHSTRQDYKQDIIPQWGIGNLRIPPVRIPPITEIGRNVNRETLNAIERIRDMPIPGSPVPINWRGCVYGRWCGPGCGGTGPPMDDVDNCCKIHDRCYDSRGYLNCNCDLELLRCLANKRDMLTRRGRYAGAIYAYFNLQRQYTCR